MKISLGKQAGLSLIELMISITLGLVLMAGVVQMFISSKTVFTTQQSMSRIQETGRLAIEFLSRDIRMAGFYGCYRPNPLDANKKLQNDALVINSLHGNFGEAIRGYASRDALTATQRSYLTGATILPNTNVLVLRSASPTPRIINATNTNYTLQVYSTQAKANGCVDGLCENDAAVASDCFRARVFEVETLTPVGTNLTIKHPDLDDWNVATDITASYSSGEVLPMNTTSYFIATGVGGAPSLWQKLNQKNAVEVLEGVEKVVYKFSTEDNATYREAEFITDWNMVNSVRIFVVARSIENNAVPEPQPYVIDGVTTTPVAPDRYMRQVFTATVGLRSRAAAL
jgi:type IV pilus assembly protein PilW